MKKILTALLTTVLLVSVNGCQTAPPDSKPAQQPLMVRAESTPATDQATTNTTTTIEQIITGINFKPTVSLLKNRDWIDHLTVKLLFLEEEIDFFHSALRSLPPELAPLMWDLTVERLTWDAVEAKHHVCRATVGKYRKKAICELDALYAVHDKEMADYILR